MNYKELINTPAEIAREYRSVYDYVPPPPTPGIRKLCGVPEERVVVKHLDENIPNFSPHLIPSYNNPNCYGMNYESFGNGNGNVMGMGMGMGGNFLMELFVFIIIIGLIIYFAKML